MHGLVLAAGEGSRLAAAGIEAPKPFVEVARRPLIARLIDALAGLGCEAITVLSRADHAEAARAIAARAAGVPVTVLGCSTPSSLHTLALGLEAAPSGPVLCAMVDTVMRPADWRAAHAGIAADLARGADAVLVVTPFVDDERPLYVCAGPSRRVTAVGDAAIEPARVTGGVYGLGPAARRVCREHVAAGGSRVRSLLAALVERGLAVTAVEVPRVVDVDRPSDVEEANRWLEAAGPGAGWAP